MRTEKIVIKGLVQGIGYRPFVAELAEKCRVNGFVRNTAGVVTIVASGGERALEAFLLALKSGGPSGARVDQITSEETDFVSFSDFRIEESKKEGDPAEIPYIPPDLPTCPSCVKQLLDASDRRYRHPFISCTACGPRYSVIEALPYDRSSITMEDFNICEACMEEYTQRGNIRRHAQTIACRECGPRLEFAEISDGAAAEEGRGGGEAALKSAVSLIKSGGILAVKDIGGFHLVCSPYEEKTVRALREIKGRERKPFAVMFADTDAVRRHCEISGEEEEELNASPRPVVLLRRAGRRQAAFAPGVCGFSPDIGAMLPCNPLQILLIQACGELIMTSANSSGGPIITENRRMLDWMRGARARAKAVRLGVLQHDRRILTPLDDSVVRIVNKKCQIFRRARGFVPNPVRIKGVFELSGGQKDFQLFAAGADMKSCFCYTAGNLAYLSQHLGDLAEEKIADCYEAESARMRRLFGFLPTLTVTDMHPLYRSVGMAREADYETMAVQHHHAHIASVMAEHGLVGNVLGVAFDGTGYGTDGAVWGSEFLLCRGAEMERLAHLGPMYLPGGDEGARNADAALYAALSSLAIEFPRGISWLDEEKYRLVKAAVLHRIHVVKSTSMGRLFDAVSALLDICHYNGYEGEAAIELEYLAEKAKRAYPLEIEIVQAEGKLCGNVGGLFRDLIRAVLNGVCREELARGFLHAVADFVTEVCVRLRGRGVEAVALSGGTFQNRILLERVWESLLREGFSVYRNERVPSGDGGICLGQAYLGILKKGG